MTSSSPSAPRSVDALLADVREQIRLERHAHAETILDEAIASAGAAASVDPALRLERARLHLLCNTRAVDEVLLDLQALRDAGDALDPSLRRRIGELRARGFVAKRLPTLAREELDAAAAEGDAPELQLVRAYAALVEDDRPVAREAYLAALALEPSFDVARLGLARLLLTMADFPAAHAELDRLAPASPVYADGLRVRAAIHGTLAEHEKEATAWRELLQVRPEGDFAQTDQLLLGLCLAALRRTREAIEELGAAWRSDPSTGAGGYARERMTFLEAAPEGAVRRELAAFPTTAQKWNYCGPAVLELVLRYFDFTADQDTIAAIVKREQGTPMVEIVGYLRQMGLEARRFEATAARIRAAIDLGCPVIVQEEYSTSSHVAVITGYDDSLGCLVSQDPMRHQPVLKSFSFTDAAGGLFGNGGIVVLGPEAQAAEKRAACDAAGLVEARHLVLVDECARRRALVHADGAEPLTPSEILRLTGEAIELSPHFKLAHYLRLQALRDGVRSGTHDPEAALDLLVQVRRRFPDDEWAHQLHALSLRDRELYDEAFVESLQASRRDPDDEGNVVSLGFARWFSGDLPAAERLFLRALAMSPSSIDAGAYLAAVLVRSLQSSDEGQPPLPKSAPAPTLPPEWLRTKLASPRPERMVRARHFLRVSIAAQPMASSHWFALGELEAVAGRRTEAIEALRQAIELEPRDSRPRLTLARLEQEEHEGQPGDLAGAERVLREGLTHAPDDLRLVVALAASLRKQKRAQEAVELLESTFDRRDDPKTLIEPLFAALTALDSSEGAAARLRQLVESRPGDLKLAYAVLEALEGDGEQGHAVGVLRSLHRRAPADVGMTWQLARLVDENDLDPEEATKLLQQVVAEANAEYWPPRVKLAWRLLDTDPAAALAVLAPVLGKEDYEIHDAQSAALAATGDTAGAERALEHALRSADDRRVALASMIRSHDRLGRHARAGQLAAREEMQGLGASKHRSINFLEYWWVEGHRIAGRLLELEEALKARCSDGVPTWLASQLHKGWRKKDPDFALRAARVAQAGATSPYWQAYWPLAVAELEDTMAGRGGSEHFDAAVKALPETADAFGVLSYSLTRLKRFTESNAAAARAYELDPAAYTAFTARVTRLKREGRTDEAKVVARVYMEKFPFRHHGPERLALLEAPTDLALASEHAIRAIEAAPGCNVALSARALTHMLAGEDRQALRFARLALGGVDALADDAPSDEESLIIAATTGDSATLERRIALDVGAELWPGFHAALRTACTRTKPQECA